MILYLGSGLGKNQTGITEALKPKIKLNRGGIGHDIAQEHTDFWWEKSFNDAASNVKIEVSANQVSIKSSGNEVKKGKKGLYLGFVKRSKKHQPVNDIEEDAETEPATKSVILNDEELFKACGGRTIHKAARHGLKLNGKLARIQQQEEEEILKLKNNCEGEQKRQKDESVKRKKIKIVQ